MKKLFTLVLFLCLTFQAFAQTDGITYQAVIIGPDELELPGVDSEGNYLPNTEVTIRFTIIDTPNTVEFQEIQTATTDDFGRINLIIGSSNPDEFQRISWNGNPKDLEVEIDFEAGNNFETMSREQLTFLPYAYHRNITATGTLTVDDSTYLNGELTVELPTNLNSTLDVVNATHLMGDLTVDGETNLNNPFTVNNNSPSTLTGDLKVNGNTDLDGTLYVLGQATVNDFEALGEATFGDLSASNLTINSNLDGDDNDINSYPVLIQGSRQGLAIVVNESRRNANNFISFWDTTEYTGNTTISGVTLAARTPTMWGRIEGETEGEFSNDADYEFDKRSLDYDQASAIIDLIFSSNDLIVALGNVVQANSSSTACAGFGVCITTPILSWIIGSAAQLIIAIAQEAAVIFYTIRATNNITLYDDNKLQYQGVTYASGAGDYAEYLIKRNTNEELYFGDIVGVVGGAVSKNTTNAEKAMVVSSKPIVLGAIPELGTEKNYAKIAFMGQVPVKVFGKVSIGDYIIPSGNNDGYGIAVNPSKIKVKDVKKIVGIAWEASNNDHGLNKIMAAVGLNNNDNNPIIERLETKVLNQETKIENLQSQLEEINTMLIKILNDEENISNTDSDEHSDTITHNDEDEKYEIVESDGHEVVYFKITDNHIEQSIKMAKQQMIDNGTDIENDIFWKKMDTDPYFKKIIMDKFKSKLETSFHYHKQINKKARN